TPEIVDLILTKASADFDWSAISPTIFGAVFESTLNPETRRSGGMHYTSIENIHKVIDPLFLDDLKAEFADIAAVAVERTKRGRLEAFQRKLAGLKFLDPACGSGNFLTETYISLRRLENEVISLLHKGQIVLDMGSPIQVSIGQFQGIEVNDFAVTVAKTALWIAESQMMKETEDVVHMSLDFLPLKSYAGIVEGNALRMDWPQADYIMGNPPFVGGNWQTPSQRDDLKSIFASAGRNTDYVSGWYFKAAQLMQGTAVRTAFVSTNSITQGDQVASIWKPLYNDFGIHIDFAYRTFRWDSEASLKAHVHCVIIGFSVAPNPTPTILFTGNRPQVVENINAYLLNADNVFIEGRSRPLCAVPEIRKGNQPTDGGNLIIEADELEDFLSKEPSAKPYIKKLIGAKEYINRKSRYCLWLVGVPPDEIRKLPMVLDRVKKVREMRESSTDAGTKRLAAVPTLFRETNNPEFAIVVPEVSSQNRRYVPMGFIGQDVICTNKLQIIPDGTLYHFGVLTSNVHMAWMRAVCGRLKSDYDYSQKIVYNNFPWPTPTDEQKVKIEQTAQAILDARALYPNASLADLYDETTMPPELRKAHQQNDKAVMQAYGFDVKTMTESTCVAELMKMYQRLLEADRT
ncbi:MAG: class I SAM-dependent DNA methyltransferase, partial [Oscillospiraceae bacterium]|nr:class I SAM-dependent DNA methyltransferase [Oscillospiraceae bacterium]